LVSSFFTLLDFFLYRTHEIGLKSRHYSDSDYVFFGAGINRYSSYSSNVYTYVYKGMMLIVSHFCLSSLAINERMLERLTTVYQHFFAISPSIIPDGVRVEGRLFVLFLFLFM
jgi:hypothetical protein